MKKAVILGGGESGFGSAVLAKVKGFDTFLSDSGTLARNYRQGLEEYDIPYEEGAHTLERILAADVIVKSPGIPDTAPVACAARERNIPVISEIEFAGRYTKGKTICITGSNGKTTTTTLTYEILRQAGYDVAVGGNIGQSFAYTVATCDKAWYVLEISSFQLDGMYDFRADTAVLMNITPDHLDRYGHSFERYAESKMRIVRNQHSRNWFIYNADDETIAALLPRYDLRMKQLPLAARTAVASGAGDAFLDGGVFVASAAGQSVEIDTARMKIHGLHNAYNAMAAALAALTAGVPAESIERTIYGFAGVEHRLEPVGEIDGVLWINDSKATNVDSVWYALESMTRPTVWIAGGTDKGNDYEPLVAFAREKVKALVCLGTDNCKLVERFTGVVPEVYSTDNLAQALECCRSVAAPGDAVLLSPACASFDLFRNYEDRGRQFKAWVQARKGTAPGEK